MTLEIASVMIILAAAMLLFVTEKISTDIVALLVLATLLLSGLVSPAEGFAGFSNPATVTVACMFVLSAGLQKTGALNTLGRGLTRWGKHQWLLLLLIMVTAGGISAFMNNTAAVAVFLPLVLQTAVARKFPSSKLLIPLSYAAQFGGVCTLIGTSTNLLVSSISARAGVGEFSMFEFSKLGLIMFGAGILYLLLFSRWLLPTLPSNDLTTTYQLGEYVTELRVMPGSPLAGKRVGETRLGAEHDVTVLEIVRNERKIYMPLHETIAEGDILLVRGQVKNLMDAKSALKVELEPEFKLMDETFADDDTQLVQALVAPHSPLIGNTVSDLNFRWRYGSVLLGLQRRGQVVREALSKVRLRAADLLLLLGRKEDLVRLHTNDELVILKEVEQSAKLRHKLPLAIGILALVVLVAALNLLPILVAALLGCLALVLTGCLKSKEAYEAVDWKVIVLLGGVLPLGIALEKTGGAQLIADTVLRFAGQSNPLTVLAAIYLVTAVLTECMSNNAAAVLLAPIAISTAAVMGVSPKPYLIAVMFAASTSFSTPVGYQTNTMVYNAGGYRFADFVRVGLPLNLLFWGLAVYFIPKFWPLH